MLELGETLKKIMPICLLAVVFSLSARGSTGLKIEDVAPHLIEACVDLYFKASNVDPSLLEKTSVGAGYFKVGLSRWFEIMRIGNENVNRDFKYSYQTDIPNFSNYDLVVFSMKTGRASNFCLIDSIRGTAALPNYLHIHVKHEPTRHEQDSKWRAQLSTDHAQRR